jgi:adenylylsulfate kinase
MIIQLCGLSGAGKTTLAQAVKVRAQKHGIKVEVIDGDTYRMTLCKDLGFSRKDRCENIRRLTKVAAGYSGKGRVAIISAIHPYREVRQELKQLYPGSIKTVFVDCPLEVLIQRDTKGLYKRALLPVDNPDRLANLTGIGDPFEPPLAPDLHLHTDKQQVEESTAVLLKFILEQKAVHE